MNKNDLEIKWIDYLKGTVYNQREDDTTPCYAGYCDLVLSVFRSTGWQVTVVDGDSEDMGHNLIIMILPLPTKIKRDDTEYKAAISPMIFPSGEIFNGISKSYSLDVFRDMTCVSLNVEDPMDIRLHNAIRDMFATCPTLDIVKRYMKKKGFNLDNMDPLEFARYLKIPINLGYLLGEDMMSLYVKEFEGDLYRIPMVSVLSRLDSDFVLYLTRVIQNEKDTLKRQKKILTLESLCSIWIYLYIEEEDIEE